MKYYMKITIRSLNWIKKMNNKTNKKQKANKKIDLLKNIHSFYFNKSVNISMVTNVLIKLKYDHGMRSYSHVKNRKTDP